MKRRGFLLALVVFLITCALALSSALGVAAPQSANSFPPPIIPDDYDSFVTVDMTANPGANAVTFVIRVKGATLPDHRYEVSAPVPAGTEMLDSWAQEPGMNPASVSEGRVKWQLRGPSQADRLKTRSVSAPYVFVVSWDGKTPLRTRGYVTTQFARNQEPYYSSGDYGWVDETGQHHWETTSDEIGVGDPAVPTSSRLRLRIQTLEQSNHALEERLRALETKQ